MDGSFDSLKELHGSAENNENYDLLYFLFNSSVTNLWRTETTAMRNLFSRENRKCFETFASSEIWLYKTSVFERPEALKILRLRDKLIRRKKRERKFVLC